MAGNGALLAVRELRHDGTILGWAPTALAALLAVSVAVYGRWRTRALATAPLPVPLAPRRAVLLFGVAIVVLAVVSAVPLVR